MPDVPGGGTVAYVNDDDHRYLADPTHREEGGTPAIIESIRAGLVFQLKEAVGTDTIRAQEERHLARAVEAWRDEPAIELLGNLDAERLSIVSFVVRSPSGRYLHHNYVVALLNDLFGIQSRGGCSCAGPYGHRLLGIDLERSHEFEREITGGCEGIKPGWVRVNFNYFVSDAVADYLIEAVRLVARDGWRLLGDYRFDTATGPLAAPRRRGRAAAAACTTSRTPTAPRRCPATTPPGARSCSPSTSATARPSWPPREARPVTAPRATSAPTSSTCAGSTCRRAPWTESGLEPVPQDGQVSWYGRLPKLSCHSASVKSRPATRHANARLRSTLVSHSKTGPPPYNSTIRTRSGSSRTPPRLAQRGEDPEELNRCPPSHSATQVS